MNIHDGTLLAALASGSAEGTPATLLRSQLWRAGLLVDAANTEGADLEHAQWKPHELWFHAETRLNAGRSLGDSFGATSWLAGRPDAPPARRPSYGERVVSLPAVDLTSVITRDPPFGEVLERRRSTRTFDSAPMDLALLSEFLFRCGRVRRNRFEPAEDRVDRPFPAGGALHELEIYVLTQNVADLGRCFFRYDAFAHELDQVPCPSHVLSALSARTGAAMAGDGEPHLLIILAARFGRLMTKYEAIGYSLILKHVGVLFQTMYLAATAMGLGACALGTGDIDLFQRATGCDPLAESSVGEFALGAVAPESE